MSAFGTAGAVASSNSEGDGGAARGGAPVVAFIDSGVDLKHPRFRGLVHRASKDFVDGDRRPQDQHGHGTHTAGIFAARARRSGAKLLVLRVLDARKAGTAATVAKALEYAIDRGATIVNMSLNADRRDAALDAAIARADREGVLITASAGNDARDLGAAPSYPACSDHANVIAVSAHTSFANRGACVDTFARATRVRSAALGGGYSLMDGTSQAAAAVAARAALIWARRPKLTARQVAAKL